MITHKQRDEAHAYEPDDLTLTAHPGSSAAQSGAEPTDHSLAVLPITAPAPAAEFPRANQVQDLGKMIETLRIVSEETRDGWMRIALAQQELGFPDVKILENATANLRRLSSDLFNAMADCEYRLGLMRMATTTARK